MSSSPLSRLKPCASSSIAPASISISAHWHAPASRACRSTGTPPDILLRSRLTRPSSSSSLRAAKWLPRTDSWSAFTSSSDAAPRTSASSAAPRRAATTTAWPAPAAAQSGVHPLGPGLSALTPASSSVATESAQPARAASKSALPPQAPAARRSLAQAVSATTRSGGRRSGGPANDTPSSTAAVAKFGSARASRSSDMQIADPTSAARCSGVLPSASVWRRTPRTLLREPRALASARSAANRRASPAAAAWWSGVLPPPSTWSTKCLSSGTWPEPRATSSMHSDWHASGYACASGMLRIVRREGSARRRAASRSHSANCQSSSSTSSHSACDSSLSSAASVAAPRPFDSTHGKQKVAPHAEQVQRSPPCSQAQAHEKRSSR
mmetsp:Transcript_13014/g.41621  ORF Transcript_13014/g.41621 Transcript_13014/m.41621 type:complete len:382 (+) Transcript_13014:189-1334(+)